ncbi:MAG: helix-hairpin-helix domain-containing protein [Isosphaeraceae bacterium]
MFRATLLVVSALCLATTAQAQQSKKDEPKKVEAKVDLNTAKLAEIEALPGIGPALSVAIAEARPFKSIDDLKKVKGMTDAKVAAIADKVTVGEATPAKPAAGKSTAKAKSKATKMEPGQKININKASLDELDALPNVGAVKAQAIIDARPFKSIDDLKKVKGIGPATFDKIKDLVVVQ